MSSCKQSYTIRFREFVQNLSKTHATSAEHHHQANTINSKKRTYEDSFGFREYDVERYGQEITDDFFHNKYGHAITS